MNWDAMTWVDVLLIIGLIYLEWRLNRIEKRLCEHLRNRL